MGRPKGSKNSKKVLLRMEDLPDVISIDEWRQWFRISRGKAEQKIRSGEVPEDCFFKSGNRTKIIKRRIAEHYKIA